MVDAMDDDASIDEEANVTENVLNYYRAWLE